MPPLRRSDDGQEALQAGWHNTDSWLLPGLRMGGGRVRAFVVGLIVFFMAVIALAVCLWLIYLDYASPKGYVIFYNIDDSHSLPAANALMEAFASQHTYDRESYNCLDYSRDAVSLLKSQGFMA